MLFRLACLILWLATASGASAAERFAVEMQTVADRKAVFAVVTTVEQAAARARIQGTIEELGVDEGSWVEQGAILARVKDERLRLRLAAIDAQASALEAEHHLAEIELDRARQLMESPAGSQARLDTAEARLGVVRGQIAALKAERAVVVEEQTQGAVLAPRTGRVLAVAVTEGTVVMPGEVIARIACDCYVLRLNLPERHARLLKQGDEVLVGRRALAEDGTQPPARAGKIRQVYPEIENGRVRADVEVEGLGDFFVGERVPVHVATGTRETFVIPPDFAISRHGIWYVTLEDRREVVIQPGMVLPEGLEVLAGLKPGDILVKP